MVCVFYVCVEVFMVIGELGTGSVSTTNERGGILPDGTTELMRYWDRGKLVLIFVAID